MLQTRDASTLVWAKPCWTENNTLKVFGQAEFDVLLQGNPFSTEVLVVDLLRTNANLGTKLFKLYSTVIILRCMQVLLKYLGVMIPSDDHRPLALLIKD